MRLEAYLMKKDSNRQGNSFHPERSHVKRFPKSTSLSFLARKQTISALRLDEIKQPEEKVISLLLKVSAKYRSGSKALEATGKGFLNQLFL